MKRLCGQPRGARSRHVSPDTKDSIKSRLMDAYMECNGYYMKPQIEENEERSFFIAKDTAKSSDVNASFELIKEAIGIKEETGNPLEL